MLIDQLGLPKIISDLVTASIDYGYYAGESDILKKNIAEVKEWCAEIAQKDEVIGQLQDGLQNLKR